MLARREATFVAGENDKFDFPYYSVLGATGMTSSIDVSMCILASTPVNLLHSDSRACSECTSQQYTLDLSPSRG
jgi:hypothetical protein